MTRYPALHGYYRNFHPIEADEWVEIESLLEPVSFKKGDYLFRAGNRTDRAHVIKRGLVKTFYVRPNGKEFIKIFLGDNQIVSPYLELLGDQPPRATAEALTDVDAFALSFKALLDCLDRSPNLMRLHLRLVQAFYHVKERREFQLLTMNAQERYAAFLTKYGTAAERIPQAAVASYLGIDPASLSRLRKRLD